VTLNEWIHCSFFPHYPKKLRKYEVYEELFGISSLFHARSTKLGYLDIRKTVKSSSRYSRSYKFMVWNAWLILQKRLKHCKQFLTLLETSKLLSRKRRWEDIMLCFFVSRATNELIDLVCPMFFLKLGILERRNTWTFCILIRPDYAPFK